jgi:hypothetical protein
MTARLEPTPTKHRRSLLTRVAGALALPLAAIAATAAGCGTTPAENTQSSANAIVILPQTTCTVGTSGAAQTLSLVATPETSGCAPGQRICPQVATTTPKLTATSTATSSTSSTTTWTVTEGATELMSATIAVSGSVQTVNVSYGAAISGASHGVFQNSGSQYSGSIDGRAIVPFSPASHAFSSGLQFADGKPAPTLTTNATYLQVVQELLEQAGGAAPASCGSSDANVVAAAKAALWQNLTSSKFPTPPSTTPPPASTPSAAKPAVAPLDSTGAASEGPTAGMDGTASFQNTPLDWVTPNCQSCESDCATNPLSWLTLGAGLVLCEAGCWIPGNGCDQDVCGVGTSCDNGQSCCGDVCCGDDQTCGNSQYGACCPKDYPVGCGDSTQVSCFAPGTTCCGNLEFGCQPGYECIVSGTTASCCPSGQVDKNGVCCSQGTLCDGVCCENGSCVNGACCDGPVSASGQCCGYAESVCGGQCCDGTCGSSGQCCPQGQPNCGVPQGTSLLFWSTTTNTGSPGDATCVSSPCEIVYWGNSFTLHGAGFFPGIAISLPTPGGSPVSVTPDSTGEFTTTITTPNSGYGNENVTITAQQASGAVTVSASALVGMENPPK